MNSITHFVKTSISVLLKVKLTGTQFELFREFEGVGVICGNNDRFTYDVKNKRPVSNDEI